MRKTVVMVVVSGLVGALVAVPVAVYASHSFTDVPDTNTFHEDIAWLADAGVTKGCNPPDNTEFCPKDAVTREQMAAFMHRLAENQVVDAGTLQGKTVAELMTAPPEALLPRAAFAADGVDPNWGNEYVLSTQITAPATGTLIMGGGIEAWHDGGTITYRCIIAIDGLPVLGTDQRSAVQGDFGGPGVEGNPEEDCTTSGAQVVDQGTYTIELEVTNAGNIARLQDATVWVMWIPLDGNGATPES